VLAVPFLDTGFVVAKRIKYRRPVYQGDSNHFHHRFHRIGFSQRRTVLYLYAWTLTMAGIAVALRFVPYSHARATSPRLGGARWARCSLSALAASVYLVYVLEILKLRRLRAWPAAPRRPRDERARHRRGPSATTSRPGSSPAVRR
jgi:UDP-GlcNAc:undecaprenyl-phosphate GlcNAc-1-phosphate transferase